MTAMLIWLFDTTVKGSLLIVLVAAIHFAIGQRVDPRFRHLLWVIVLLRLLMPVAPTSPVSMFPPEVRLPMERRVELRATALPVATPMSLKVTLSPDSTIQKAWRIGFWVWLVGALAFGLRTLLVAVRMHRTVGRVAAPNGPGLRVVETDAVATPALYGVFRPLLLLPRGLSETEVRHVVLHETWHLKRLDVAVSWLLAAAQTIHWFNPLVWFAASRIREERELSCDELALSLLQEEERLGYGRTILKLLERFATAGPVPALVGMVDGKKKMKRRIMMIASFKNRSRFTMLFLILVAAVGAAGLTDANGKERFRVMKKFDPAVAAGLEKLETRVTFDLANASFAELLATVANKAGVAVTQSPELATLDVQNARFTLKAENVPAHAVLMEALMPFELSAEPTAEGVAIVNRPTRMFRAVVPGDVEQRVIVTKGERTEGDRVMRALEADEHDGEMTEKVFIKKLAPASFDANGRLHRELDLEMTINGESSKGKLTLDIQK